MASSEMVSVHPNLERVQVFVEPNTSAPAEGSSGGSVGATDGQGTTGTSSSPSAVDAATVVVQEKGAASLRKTGKTRHAQTEADEGSEQKGAGSPTPAGSTACVVSSSLPALPPASVVAPKDLQYQGPTDESK